MKIDRHNYEEFFILYWDDELAAAQKQAVENFIKENPDLQEEFKILGETRFTPDNHVQFEEKEFLLNRSFINITNYEEHLLNYIDDELNSEERKEVEKTAAKYPAVQKELVLLQKTKLQPESEVGFHGKSVLYRREEKPDSYRVRVISMTWFRVAVAAAIILIAGFVTLRLVNTNKSIDIPPVANVNEAKDQPSKNKIDPAATQQKDQTGKDKEEAFVKANDDKSRQVQKEKKADKKTPVKEIKTSDPLIAYKPENKNDLPKENTQPNDRNAKTNGLIADANFPLEKDKSTVQKNNADVVNTSFDNSDVTKSSSISSVKIDDGNNDDNFGKKEKGGLKEFLRKTTRVFERRTKIQATTEDNKLLVGAFAVSLK